MPTAQQLDLEFDACIRSLADFKPNVAAKEPVIWVEHLEVHKDTPSGDSTRLRRIKLRKGLNVLWASSSGAKPGRLGGHGAGKTTFSRLLRYAIGDSKPGNRQFRENFRAKFANGWVLADVWVAGQLWLVGRPLGEKGHHPWAARGASLASPLPESSARQNYRNYEEALETATMGHLKTRKLSGSGTALKWPHLLPWLSRDQEAHYASLIEWRVKESDSESDSLSAADRENLMRIVLGLVDPEEQKRLRDRERVAQEHERLTRERPQREYHRKQAGTALAALFSGTIGHPGDLFFEEAIHAEVSKLRDTANESLMVLQDDEELKNLVSEEAARMLELNFVVSQIDEIEGAIVLQTDTAKATGHRASNAKHLTGTTKFLPFKGYCSTPLAIAHRDRCPCVTVRPDDDEVQKTTQKIIATAGAENDRLAKLQERISYLEKDQIVRTHAFKTAQAASSARRQSLNERFKTVSIPRDKAAALEAAYKAYVTAEETVTAVAETIDALSKEKTALDKAIEAHAKSHRSAMTSFGDLFNAIVQAMLGEEVTGRIDFAGGKTLDPKLDFHGSFDSAALSLTKLLAFDLAALSFSLFEGLGHHPRFLLHDSPRESDLAAPIYSSLFLAAHAIEEACGKNIGFQYIVTTTEAPPEKLRKEPWLLDPILDATVAENRFLGIDL